MAKLTAASILSILVALLGVFFYIAAVGGMLFEQPTPAGDIGLLSVTMVLVALGVVGFWASRAERKTQP